MKLAIAILFLTSSLGHAMTDGQRLAELENKVQALETAMEEKLGDCQMVYKHHSYRLNQCDRGTFAHSITQVGGGSLQLACGYYQLACSKSSKDY